MIHLLHKKSIAIAIITSVCATIVGIAAWKVMFPYGYRYCTLRCMYFSLMNYAEDHQGWFPDAVTSPMALQLLYPSYSSGRELSGISGEIDSVVQNLKAGQPLSQALTSWQYTPGLRRDDNPKLAILWESKPGLYPNGRKNWQGSRAVLLINGDITNITESDWSKFQKEQETLGAASRQRRIKVQ